MIYQEGYLNKKVDLHSGETGHRWKVYKVLLKSSKLYFFRPSPTDEKPKFQDAKDHQRHQMSLARGLEDDPFNSLHSQYSCAGGGASSRMSITNECGMVLSAFKFESSTRTLLFEGNAKALGQGTFVFAPPVSRYIYGESFTEIDRATMQFKRHVALLLFEDTIMICKRKWIRSTATKVKDAIKFSSSNHEKTDRQDTLTNKRQPSTASGISHKSGDSRGSESEPKSRGSVDRSSDKQRGYFTKWKHEATYLLSDVEALDMASPVPSASATFYPFAAPATAATASLASVSRNPRDSDGSSIYRPSSAPSHNYQTTSTLELVITSSIDGKEYTDRLLFLPPSQEVRHRWFSKFNRAKELQMLQSKTTTKGRGMSRNGGNSCLHVVRSVDF
jgi:hypothetical protein